MAKVLIIEDEKAMSDLISVKFQVEGFEVEQALSLGEARNKFAANTPYHAILTDYLLPDGNALDLLAEMKANPTYTQVPIVIMTNYVEDMNADRAKQLGVDKILVKYQTVPAQMVEEIKQLIVGITSGPAPQAPAATPAAAAPAGQVPAPEPQKPQ